jgi:hypothetical protein
MRCRFPIIAFVWAQDIQKTTDGAFNYDVARPNQTFQPVSPGVTSVTGD